MSIIINKQSFGSVGFLVGANDVRVFQLDDGRIPFFEWLDGIKDQVTRARIETKLLRLAAGNPADSKSVGAGIIELRLHFGNGYRVYYGKDAGRLIILLVGGCKHGQSKDIKLARKYWAVYKGIGKYEKNS